MKKLEILEKARYLLLNISRDNNESEIIEICKFSHFEYSDAYPTRVLMYGYEPTQFLVHVKLIASVYTKYFKRISEFEDLLFSRLNQLTDQMIFGLKIVPDYEKVNIIHSEIVPVLTQWEEINELQNKMVINFLRSSDSMDYQNLGNIARTIMDKLAREVFDPKVHNSSNETLNIAKFKSQLHLFIKFKMSGDKNAELRKFGTAAIEFVEQAIDLMNNTTHKHGAKLYMAEICINSTIGAVNIVKVINEL